MFDPAIEDTGGKARSRFGNHSATVFTAAGKLPDSQAQHEAREVEPATDLASVRGGRQRPHRQVHTP